MTEHGDEGECHYSIEDIGSPSHSVVDAVSSAEGVGPTDLPPLFEVIDPEALDALFRDDTEVEVTFEYQGYEITARNDTGIVVRQPEPTP